MNQIQDQPGAADGRQPVQRRAHDVLTRNFWVILHDRLWPDEIMDKLYEKRIIEERLLSQLRAEQVRYKKVELLLDRVKCLDEERIREFAVILANSEGIDDVGRDMLRKMDEEETR
jgi:hypothetical protein